MIVLMVLLLVTGAGCAGSGRPPMTFWSSDETRALGLPFSDAVRAGPFLFVSGQIGNRPGTLELAPGGIRPEARQALENIRAILRDNGSSMERVVKCTVFLADIAEWAAFNAVYAEFFPTDPPARSALGANGLALGARVEVDCLAFVPTPSEG
jgi:reactive intermediate/imine deaminase